MYAEVEIMIQYVTIYLLINNGQNMTNLISSTLLSLMKEVDKDIRHVWYKYTFPEWCKAFIIIQKNTLYYYHLIVKKLWKFMSHFTASCTHVTLLTNSPQLGCSFI
jgi:hypothetical protein